MMGQKETMAVAEEIGGGTLRRMILVVTAVALMAVNRLMGRLLSMIDAKRRTKDGANEGDRPVR